MDVLNELARQEMFYIALGYLVIGIFVVGAVFLREKKEDQKLNDYMVELKPNFAERRRCQKPYHLYSLIDRRDTKGRDLEAVAKLIWTC